MVGMLRDFVLIGDVFYKFLRTTKSSLVDSAAVSLMNLHLIFLFVTELVWCCQVQKMIIKSHNFHLRAMSNIRNVNSVSVKKSLLLLCQVLHVLKLHLIFQVAESKSSVHHRRL